MDREHIAQLVEELKRRQTGNLHSTYFTTEAVRKQYPKHMMFMAAGKDYKQRLMMAANRCGKTTAMAYELVCHLTGNYPSWWSGKTFPTCNHWWVVGRTSETVKQILQTMLLGPVGDFGTGMVPREVLDFDTLKEVTKAGTGVSTFRVKHKNGTYSTVEFKSAEQSRRAFEGTERSIWLDEEPPLDIYVECLLRTMTGDNILVTTFTPLLGISEMIMNFLEGSDFSEGPIGISKHVTMASWDDVPHLTEEAKKQLLASIPPFQRDARTKGLPQLGSGAIYPVAEEQLYVEPFEIPRHWQKAYGLDVGRNTAAIFIARDPDANQLYVYSDHLQVEGTPSSHVDAIQARGKWLKGAIDTSARGRSQTDGENLFEIYTEKGLHIVNADKAVEAGLYEVLELMMNGRLKIFDTCVNLKKELRMYRRDEQGKVIKKHDHCADAFRYAIFNRDKILRTEAAFKALSEPLEIDTYHINSPDNWMAS